MNTKHNSSDKISDEPRTRNEAIELALAWAEGRRSWLNLYMGAEASPEDRTRTLADCAVADAQEVIKWTAIAAVLPDLKGE